MTFEIIAKIVLFGIALAMDAFAVSITDGLIYTDLNKKKSCLIAGTFAVLQALMPLIGYWLLEIVVHFVGEQGGIEAAKVLSLIITWVAFGLLIIIGGKMILIIISNDII